jgi:hypothetical protein
VNHFCTLIARPHGQQKLEGASLFVQRAPVGLADAADDPPLAPVEPSGRLTLAVEDELIVHRCPKGVPVGWIDRVTECVGRNGTLCRVPQLHPQTLRGGIGLEVAQCFMQSGGKLRSDHIETGHPAGE